MSREIRVLLLPRYSPEAASSRRRFFDMVPALEAAGFTCTIAPFFDEGYLSGRFARRSQLIASTLLAYRRRWQVLRTLRHYDVGLVQMELLPYMPWLVERRAMADGLPWVLDYDDAWFHRYGDHTNSLIRLALSDKIAAVMARATVVLAGSAYIQEYASHLNHNVRWLPTSIDLDRYPAQPPLAPEREFVIGWIGSPGTSAYLAPLENLLRDFCGSRRARVVVMGAGDDAPQGSHVTRIPWSSATEVDEIARWHVGIMPLSDTPFARGKCAFKLIQYMGCWKPVIASPVGENNRVVEHGVNGFLASTMAQWTEALGRLYEDRALGARMGVAGRLTVERDYSQQVVAPRLAASLAAAVDDRRRSAR